MQIKNAVLLGRALLSEQNFEQVVNFYKRFGHMGITKIGYNEPNFWNRVSLLKIFFNVRCKISLFYSFV